MSLSWFKYGRDHPALRLLALFVAWKSLLALIVLAAPGVGYDTSTSLLSSSSGSQNDASNTPQHLYSTWLRFVRWDALYYTHMSEQGHVFEQEWAFGVGLSTALSWTAICLLKLGISPHMSTVFAGILISHVFHWLSVTQVWALTRALVGDQTNQHNSLSFTAAALHIISPAGVFLSAPYSEALFSCFSMSGSLSLVYALHNFDTGLTSAGCRHMLHAGVRFMAATMVRSNGILTGISFFVEAYTTALGILSQSFSRAQLTRLASILVGGLLIGCGLVYPQFLAYRDYCYGRAIDNRRPWCNQMLPSIFTWVQSHYWNVGLFRYWTMSNLPLFLLAAPSLWLLIYSAIDILRHPEVIRPIPSKPSAGSISSLQMRMVASLALPQLVLAILALTSYHVQIITRLSSGYPLWYIWLAVKLQREPKGASMIVRWMVLYALIQAGLYACFLPPA